MRKYGKWVLTLGILAATPTISSADGIVSRDASSRKTAATGEPTPNQAVANNIAAALRGAGIRGHKVQIAFDKGTATLGGGIATPEEKQHATQVVSRVPGVRQVENRLTVIGRPPNAQAPATGPATGPAAGPGRPSPIQQVAASEPARYSNQEVAEGIAGALSSAGLAGYDVEIQYQNGVALLGGNVDSPQQAMLAGRVCSQVPGVRQVENRLMVAGPPQFPPGSPYPQPVTQTAYNNFDGGIPPAPAGDYGPPMDGGYAPYADGSGAMGQPVDPTPYGHPGAVGAQPGYDMPYMPDHAWPSYAAYPNYAGVSYPSQYSASAWPYIGPFYPYPQVPLGWRKASLEWDDGYWQLGFNSKTDKWWWFMNPKNW